MIRALIPLALLAAPALADVPASVRANADKRLSRITAGRVAGAPVRCIRPERAVPPMIIDGTAIVYRDVSTAYVARFTRDCPILREGRTVITSSLNGEMCVNDWVRVADSGMQLGQCVFDSFTPYTKVK